MENNGRQVQQNKSRVINLGNAGNSIFMKFYSDNDSLVFSCKKDRQ